MKLKSIVYLLLVLPVFCSYSQEIRYFEFYHPVCAENDWRDSSFIAATSDPEVIDEVLKDLEKPEGERRLINGPIEEGHGEHNFNNDHAFLWHFTPNEWGLAEVAIEVCDGCPHTMVDENIDYWLNTVGQYCPWNSFVRREVDTPVSVTEAQPLNIKVFPNPARNEINIVSEGTAIKEISIIDMNGKTLINRYYHDSNIALDLSALPEGLYILQVKSEDKYLRKLINVIH